MNRVPKLRFPEFSGEWEENKLENKMRIFRGASPRPKGDLKYYNGPIPRVMIEDVTRDGKYVYPKIDSLTIEGAKKSRFLNKGSFILSCSGTKVAIPGILSVDACIHDGFFGFDSFNNVNTEFLYNYFLLFHEKLQDSATKGGIFNNLTTEIMKNLNVIFPSLSEQQEIASFLSSTDSKIEKLERKKELWEHYKKGVMQKIFSQELRFKDENRNDYPEWKEILLEEVAYAKGRIGWKNLKQEEYTKEGPFLIAGKHIKNGKINWSECDHITEERYNESIEIALKNGDIIFSKDGSLGNPALIENLTFKATINGTMMVLRCDKTKIDPKYLYHIMCSQYFEKLLREVKSGSSIPHIFQRDIINLKFPLPPLLEQNQIAEIFSSIDIKIETIGKGLERVKDFKKGLLQQMFV